MTFPESFPVMDVLFVLEMIIHGFFWLGGHSQPADNDRPWAKALRQL